MIMIGPCLPWLVLGDTHKPNSAKDSMQSLAVLNNYGLTQ